MRDVALFESYGARWERLYRFKSGDEVECSGERLLFGFDGDDFLDLAAGRYPENPLKDCSAEILWIGLLQDRARKVFGIIGPDIGGETLCVALVRFSPRLGCC